MTQWGWVSRGFATGCVLVASACGGAPRASVAPAAVNPCSVAEGPPAADTLTVALSGVVDAAHAPAPASAAERIVFRSIYETLIRVDCRGTVRPGLAARWRSEDGGRRWVFELRGGAAFSDGLPVTAETVAESWRADATRRPQPWTDSLAGSISVLDARTVAVSFARPQDGVPRILADPSLAIARPAPDGAVWPLGSGAYAVVGSRDGRIVLLPRVGIPRDALPVLVFVAGDDDPRDLLDAGVDLMVTRDRAVTAYASAAGASRVIPLPWDLVYVLLAPAVPGDPRAFETVNLADDLTAAAAGSDARPPEPSYWWESAAACTIPESPIAARTGASPEPRIVYQRNDRTARGLAERLVALAASGRVPASLLPAGGAPRVAASGLDRPSWDAAVRAGSAIGYIAALERPVLDVCAAAEALAVRAPWPARLVPLIDTRAVLVVRRVAGTVALDWDGTPFLVTAEREP